MKQKVTDKTALAYRSLDMLGLAYRRLKPSVDLTVLLGKLPREEEKKSGDGPHWVQISSSAGLWVR